MSASPPVPPARPAPSPGKARLAPFRAQGPAPAAAQAALAKASPRLADATSGLVMEPLSLLVYGVEGVGKTSFAAGAPSPLILGAEAGSAEIGHVRRLSPTSFGDVLGILEELAAGAHNFRTVGIDSIDWLEPLVWRAVCDQHGKSDIEAFGYGKGYGYALDEWRRLLRSLDVVRSKGINTVLIAHSAIKPWKNPDGADFDRWTMKLNDKAGSLVREWSKAVLFANFERGVVEKDNRAKGVDTGKRLLFTRMSASYDAKNRLWLPPEMPLGWAPFARAVRAGDELRTRFYAAIATMDDEAREAAIEHMESNDYTPEAAESVIASVTSTAA